MNISNKKARLNYQILDTLEAGVELLGPEVKSIRAGEANIDHARVTIGIGQHGLEARLIGMQAHPYLPAASQKIDPNRPRKLLLHKNQIQHLYTRSRAIGGTIIPLRVYTKHSWIKVEIALVRGKKKWQKRERLKNKDVQREMERAIRQSR